MENEKLLQIVTALIDSKMEGEYWDFKLDFHDNKAELLHDILCMANNPTPYDGMIIFGVQDRTFEVIGVEGNKNRRNLNYYINFLKDKKIAGGIKPKLGFQTIFIGEKAIDVLLIKNTDKTPYYLDEDYTDRGKRVRAYHIYTRVGESNTDINKSADIDQAEKLWAKRLKVMKRIPNFKIKLLRDDESEDNAVLSYTYTYPAGLLRARPYDEGDLIDGVTIEDIHKYNEALPDKELIDEFNNQQKLYENVQENSHEVYLSLENIGNAPGTSVYITLFLPPELLVYSKNDCACVHEPEELDMPEDPVRKAMDADYYSQLERYLDCRPELEAAIKMNEQYYRFQIPDRRLLTAVSVEENDFSIRGAHEELEVYIKKLLHTRIYESDKFFLIVTKQGKFKIEYEIMCEEIEEPQTGTFEIVVDL